MLSGFGSIQAMINTIKQNKQMLGKRKNIYTRGNTERGFRPLKQLQKEELSEVLRACIKRKSVIDKKQSRTKNWIVGSMSLVLLTFLIAWFNQLSFTSHSSPNLTDLSNNYTPKKDLIKNTEMGTLHANQGNWFMALGYFEKALAAQPNNLTLKVQVLEMYCNLCFYEKKACEQASSKLKVAKKEGIPSALVDMFLKNCMY